MPLKSQYPEIWPKKEEQTTAVPLQDTIYDVQQSSQVDLNWQFSTGTRSQELVQQKEINKKGKKEKRRNQS